MFQTDFPSWEHTLQYQKHMIDAVLSPSLILSVLNLGSCQMNESITMLSKGTYDMSGKKGPDSSFYGDME